MTSLQIGKVVFWIFCSFGWFITAWRVGHHIKRPLLKAEGDGAYMLIAVVSCVLSACHCIDFALEVL